MSDNNEFDPQIEASIRDLPAAEPSLREQHIAAALAEMAAPDTRNGRLRFLSAAAAVLILVAVGIGFSKNSGDTPPAIAADSSTTTLAKAAGDCGEEFSGLWGDSVGRGDFTWAETDYTVIGHNGGLSVYLAMEPCTMMGDIAYWEAMTARDKEAEAPQRSVECESMTPVVAQFEDRGNGNPYQLDLVKTDTGVTLYFEDRCNEPLGSITLPPSGD
jgi:hypothetical protein